MIKNKYAILYESKKLNLCKITQQHLSPSLEVQGMAHQCIDARVKTTRAEQSRAEQSRAEQSRAEQSRAEQSRAEQSRAEQSSSPETALG